MSDLEQVPGRQNPDRAGSPLQAETAEKPDYLEQIERLRTQLHAAIDRMPSKEDTHEVWRKIYYTLYADADHKALLQRCDIDHSYDLENVCERGLIEYLKFKKGYANDFYKKLPELDPALIAALSAEEETTFRQKNEFLEKLRTYFLQDRSKQTFATPEEGAAWELKWTERNVMPWGHTDHENERPDPQRILAIMRGEQTLETATLNKLQTGNYVVPFKKLPLSVVAGELARLADNPQTCASCLTPEAIGTLAITEGGHKTFIKALEANNGTGPLLMKVPVGLLKRLLSDADTAPRAYTILTREGANNPSGLYVQFHRYLEEPWAKEALKAGLANVKNPLALQNAMNPTPDSEALLKELQKNEDLRIVHSVRERLRAGNRDCRDIFDQNAARLQTLCMWSADDLVIVTEKGWAAMHERHIRSDFNKFKNELWRDLPGFTVQLFREMKLADDPVTASCCLSNVGRKVLGASPEGIEILRRAVRLAPEAAMDAFAYTKERTPDEYQLVLEAASLLPPAVLEAKTRYLHQDDRLKMQLPAILQSQRIREQTLERMLAPLLQKTTYGEKHRQQKSLFAQDPALFRNFPEVHEHLRKQSSTPGKDLSYAEMEKALHIARNLYIQGLEPTPVRISREYARLNYTLERFRTIPMFKGRSVHVLAHNETIRDVKGDDGKPYTNEQYALSERTSGTSVLFGKPGLLSAITKQRPASLSITHAYDSTPAGAKKMFLEKIQTEQNPGTYIFDGHGGPDAFYLSSGQDPSKPEQTAVSISVQELADAMETQYKNHNGAPLLPSNRTILIFAACYSNNFVRSLLAELTRRTVPLPVVMGEAEYNQLGFSDLGSKTGARFFDDLFEKHDGATLGTLIEMNENPDKGDTNIQLYVPSEEEKPMQIADTSPTARADAQS